MPEHRRLIAFRSAFAWALILLLSGCIGELKSEQELQAKIDKLADASSNIDDGVGDVTSPDTVAEKDEASVPKDTATAKDTAGPPECVTDDDCEGKVLGKTACKPPKCNAGKCELGQLETGTPCVFKGVVGECEQPVCSAEGACLKQSRDDGTVCGPYTCGKKCEAGTCVAAVPADYEDGNPCTKDSCKDGIEVLHEPITDLNLTCDDGDPCTQKTACFEGACKGEAVKCDNGVACAVGSCKQGVGCEFEGKNSLCDDGDPCTKETCDQDKGCAVSGYADVTVTCDDGNQCTDGDHCADKGACTGKSSCDCKTDADCADKADNLCLGAQICTAGVCVVDPAKKVVCDPALNTACLSHDCQAATGKCALVPANKGNSCDDGNACTDKATCQDDGTCAGPLDVKCDDKNACTDDACDPVKGCVFEQNTAKCDDGDACTSDDACAAGGCVGKQKVCDDKVPCTTNACSKKTGACSYKPNNYICDDGNPCTKDLCDAKAGCTKKADDAGKCDDNDKCTTNSCKGGSCIAKYTCDCKTGEECDDKNPCTNDSCKSGKCSNTAVGDSAKKKCSTGDACEIANSGVCTGGQCKSTGKKKDCSGKNDACNVGACDPQTGECVKSAKGNGTTCDADGSGCTTGDQCKGGLCTAGPKVDCSAKSGPCTVGTCVSKSKTTHACTAKAKKSGTACEDGKYCTVLDKCDAAGVCKSGSLRTCAEQKDTCNLGKCFEAEKKCGKTPKPPTAKCNDGQYCTVSDHCQGGKCIGGAARSCPDSGACKSPACSENKNKCTLVNDKAGGACEDGSKCTTPDKCDGKGGCKAGPTKGCKPPSGCMDAFCDPKTGACQTKPTKAGTACNDGEHCTQGDVCNGAGKCSAGGWNFSDPLCQCKDDSNCDDKKQCTKDECKSKKCVFTIDDGVECEDNNACTTESKCTKAGQCAGTKFYDCKGNDCNDPYCVQAVGKAMCKLKPKAAGTKCDDKKKCTVDDKCNAAGNCTKTSPKNCSDGVACTLDSCQAKDGKCLHSDNCDDGDSCTNDTCDKGSGKCVYTSAKDCNDGNACTLDDCEDGKCTNDPLTGKACSDGNACTVSDTCKAGTCGGSALTCNDANPCTKETCEPAKGCVFVKQTGAVCNDGKPCTVKDKCKDGTCKGVARTCDDKNKCTTDSCLTTDYYKGYCHNKKTSWTKCGVPGCQHTSQCPKSSDPCLKANCKKYYHDSDSGYCQYKEACLGSQVGGGG